MPLYEYRCEQCGEVFEVIEKFSDQAQTTHVKCGGKVERLISAPALQFKGSGWYITDYAKGSGTLPSGGSSSNGESSKDSASKDASSKESGSKDSGSKGSGGGDSGTGKNASESAGKTTSTPASTGSTKAD